MRSCVDVRFDEKQIDRVNFDLHGNVVARDRTAFVEHSAYIHRSVVAQQLDHHDHFGSHRIDEAIQIEKQ